METELSERKGAILEDFEKLVDIKAFLKVGLFRLSNSARTKAIVDEMKKIQIGRAHV